jgi:hypothetical protein
MDKTGWIPGVMGLGSNCLLGVELAVGQIALIGSLVVFISLLFYVIRRQKYSLFFTLFGGLVTMFCSLVWIMSPGVLILSRMAVYYTVIYGTYVALSGSVLTSASAVLALRSYKSVLRYSRKIATSSDAWKIWFMLPSPEVSFAPQFS